MATLSAKIVGNQLQIAIDITEGFPLSSTEKLNKWHPATATLPTSLMVEGKPVIIGLNAYISNK